MSDPADLHGPALEALLMATNSAKSQAVQTRNWIRILEQDTSSAANLAGSREVLEYQSERLTEHELKAWSLNESIAVLQRDAATRLIMAEQNLDYPDAYRISGSVTP